MQKFTLILFVFGSIAFAGPRDNVKPKLRIEENNFSYFIHLYRDNMNSVSRGDLKWVARRGYKFFLVKVDIINNRDSKNVHGTREFAVITESGAICRPVHARTQYDHFSKKNSKTEREFFYIMSETEVPAFIQLPSKRLIKIYKPKRKR
jgi:hypothetical protein